MHRFKRLALQIDLAVETIVWDIFIENWPVDVDANDDLVWAGEDPEAADAAQRGFEQDDSYGFGFEPSGDF